GHAGLARTAPRLRRQPAVEHDPGRQTDAGSSRQARRALRALRIHPGRHLAHRFVRSMGCRARQGAGPAHPPQAREQERTQAQPRQFDKKLDSPLPQAQGGISMTVGFDKPLYVLPFDHRGSFQTKMFGWKGTLTPEQTAEIAATKQVIYDAFQAAIK